MASVRTEVDQLKKLLEPERRKPLDGFAQRMRARQGRPPSGKPSLPGSLAWTMQQREARRLLEGLA